MSEPSSVTTDILAGQTDLAARIADVFGRPGDALEAVERRAAELLPELRVIVWEGDPETFQFSYVSRSAESLLGYGCDLWVSEPSFWVDTVVHPDDRSAAVAYCALATGQGRDHDFRYRAIAADGRTVVIHDMVQVSKGHRGVATRLRGIMVDVT